ncbi:MAG TPA: DUF3604 domain-containing protein [Pseudomonadales bacterium]
MICRLLLACLAAVAMNAAAQESATPAPTQHYSEIRSPCAQYNPLRNAYFGDTHVHTYLSLDAGLQGTRTTPDQAYRFAKGEPIGLQPWTDDGKPLRSLQLARPLDFVAISDHAEFLGEQYICQTPGADGYDSWQCGFYRRAPSVAFIFLNMRTAWVADRNQQGQALPIKRFDYCGPDGSICRNAASHGWQELQQAAETHYDRSSDCQFTTFVGYEWSGGPKTENLHRNVLFRNSQVPELPSSYLDTPDPEELWAYLDRECLQRGKGCDTLTIPHNSNVSNGRMFALTESNGKPFTAEYAKAREQFEPLIEIFQHKGDSECSITSSDEQCGFEKMPFNNLIADRYNGWLTDKPNDSDYVRDALKQGLLAHEKLGTNPFHYGIIASTDTHLGAPGAASENNFPGHGGAGYSARDGVRPGFPDPIAYNPGGLAVVYAEENSRDAIFDGMKRRETYGTSGPRIGLRFFGGRDFPADLCDSPDFIATGYAQGTPMGGMLSPVADETGLMFAVAAQADPGAGGEPAMPLQRIQIIKGWVENGVAHEKVFDVAGTPNNGASVDTNTCVPQGDGYRQLCAVWRDPEFKAQQSAFYYARTLENPSCRWTTRQCVAAGVNCSKPETITAGYEACCAASPYPKTIQERAWSSPVWYSPALAH